MGLLIDIRREPIRSVITLRPYPRWRTVWTSIAVTVVAAVLALLPAPESMATRLFRVVVLFVGVLSLYVAVLASAWYLLGREVITAAGDSITIEHYIWRRRKRRTTYSSSGITNLRSVGRGQVMQRGRLVSAFASALAFDYQGKAVRFGAGLVGTDVESVLEAMKDAIDFNG